MCKRTTGLLLAAAVLLAAVPNRASADEARWDMFVTGGWTTANLNDTDHLVANDQSINGYTAGVAFQLRIYNEFAIEAGARYTQKGGKGTIDSTFAIPNYANVTQQIGDATVRLNYIEFPLMFAYVLETSYSSYLRAYAGPSINWLVSADVTGQVEGVPFEDDSKSLWQNAEWSVAVGASWNYDFGGWQALIDGRWVTGLTGVNKSTTLPDLKVTTETWEFSLGVGFKLAGY